MLYHGPVSSESVSVFISYSHADEAYRKDLGIALASLRDEEKVSEWHDRRIEGGEEWDDVIRKQLDKADVIILLLSADFIASDYIRKIEIPAGTSATGTSATERYGTKLSLKTSVPRPSPLGPTEGLCPHSAALPDSNPAETAFSISAESWISAYLRRYCPSGFNFVPYLSVPEVARKFHTVRTSVVRTSAMFLIGDRQPARPQNAVTALAPLFGQQNQRVRVHLDRRPPRRASS